MINSKQRAFLRAMANKLDCQFQIGKGEVDANQIRSLDEFLSTHELVKANCLKTAQEQPRVLAEKMAAAVEADIVTVVGRKFVLYRHSDKLAKLDRDIKLP